jgi:phosphatidate cytidylyltransferase
MFSFLGLIRDLPVGAAWLFIVLATTFGADTGAYFFGHLLGKHKLAPRVSPSKTVEGLVGGLIFSIALAFGFKYLIINNFSIRDCLWVGGIAGLVGPIGDLCESLIKRSVGVKDSGDLIPGHGGILDRVDALLFTAPVVYYYAAYIR